ncbi:MAG TPA: hypothetical protein VGH19_02350 [Verrucomicrobiae bacterium]
MFTRSGKILVALALAFSLGAHWSLLQVVAWVNMTVAYSQDATLGEAIEKTFDGKHACQLCKLVDEGKQKEQQQSTTVQKHKLDLINSSTIEWVTPATAQQSEFPSVSAWRSFREPPTLPPPRVA